MTTDVQTTIYTYPPLPVGVVDLTRSPVDMSQYVHCVIHSTNNHVPYYAQEYYTIHTYTTIIQIFIVSNAIKGLQTLCCAQTRDKVIITSSKVVPAFFTSIGVLGVFTSHWRLFVLVCTENSHTQVKIYFIDYSSSQHHFMLCSYSCAISICFSSCFITISALRLVLYFSYSTCGNALTVLRNFIATACNKYNRRTHAV